MEELNKERNESIHSGTRPTNAAATIWPVQSNSPSSSSHTSVWLTLRCISSTTGNLSCIAFFLVPHSEKMLKLELSSFVWVLLLLGNSFLSLSPPAIIFSSTWTAFFESHISMPFEWEMAMDYTLSSVFVCGSFCGASKSTYIPPTPGIVEMLLSKIKSDFGN